MTAIWRSEASTVILVDPELFVVGTLVARTRRKAVIIDIHEDFAKAVAARTWVPDAFRPAVSRIAKLNDRIGRLLATTVIVAAPELATVGSQTVLNIPDPSEFDHAAHLDSGRVVYVGDVTIARGALEIAELAALMPDIEIVVVGRVSREVSEQMNVTAGKEAKLTLVGQLPHDQAWQLASGATAGLSLLHALPAYNDAVATKLWEYCAAGIPPIVSNLPGQKKFVQNLDQSLACDTLEDVAILIRRLAENGKWASDISKRCRFFAEEAWQEYRPDLALYRAVAP